MQPAIPEAYLELVLTPRRVKVARPPGYMALTSYSAGLHHVMSEDRCSASFQQPSAPLRAPGLAVLPPNVVFHARIWAPLSGLRLSLVRDSNRFHSGRRMLPPFLTAGLAVFSKESASGALNPKDHLSPVTAASPKGFYGSVGTRKAPPSAEIRLPGAED